VAGIRRHATAPVLSTVSTNPFSTADQTHRNPKNINTRMLLFSLRVNSSSRYNQIGNNAKLISTRAPTPANTYPALAILDCSRQLPFAPTYPIQKYCIGVHWNSTRKKKPTPHIVDVAERPKIVHCCDFLLASFRKCKETEMRRSDAETM
jgi:hypothetical protein